MPINKKIVGDVLGEVFKKWNVNGSFSTIRPALGNVTSQLEEALQKVLNGDIFVNL